MYTLNTLDEELQAIEDEMKDIDAFIPSAVEPSFSVEDITNRTRIKALDDSVETAVQTKEETDKHAMEQAQASSSPSPPRKSLVKNIARRLSSLINFEPVAPKMGSGVQPGGGSPGRPGLRRAKELSSRFRYGDRRRNAPRV